MKFLKYCLLTILTQVISTTIIAQTAADEQLIAAAITLKDEGKNDQAIENCTKALAINPNSAWAYNVRAIVYNSKAEYDKAIADYTEAIRLNVTYTNAWYNRGLSYYNKGEYDKAIADDTEAIRIDPKYINAWYNRALAYDKKGETDKVIADYTEAIRLDSKYVNAWNNRGLAYDKKGEYDKAIADYTEAIRLDPTYTNAWYNRGLSHYDKGEYDKAIADYTEAIRLNAAYTNAWYNRGLSYYNKGEYDKAIPDYTQAIRLDAEYTNAWYNRGLAYYYKGEYDKAITDDTEAIRLDAKYANAWYNRGLSYYKKAEYDKVIADYTEAIRLDPKYANAWNNRGLTYVSKGEYDKAIADYAEVVSLDPNYSRAYINIISPLVRKLRFASAKDYYNQYKSKGLVGYIDNNEKWNFFKSYITAATENIPNGLFDVALKNLDIALKEYGTEIKEENKSGYMDILALKGYVLEQLKRTPEAKDVYNQVLIINSNQPDVKEALQRLEQKQVIVTDNKPPVIELLSPQTTRGLNIVSANENTEIIGRAKDDSGLDRVTINGQIIKTEEDGIFISTLPLKAGTNEILITATDKQGNKAEKTFTLTGNSNAKQDNTPVEIVMPASGVPQYHAILIAAQKYEDKSIPSLENPVKDAKELRTILQDNYTFRSENIDTVYNRSREEIMQVIVQKCNKLTENDNLLIFYAGHGIAEKDKFGDVDGYWIPSSAKKGLNASYISADDINKALKRSNSKHILVIADACFSGSFTRTLGTDASAGIQKQYSVPSRKVMASGNLEPVPDNSRFIYYLKKNLKENKEKYLTGEKLFDSFKDAVRNNSDTSPQYAAIKNVGDEGGEFVFIRK
jgi:tetratricopeptide (TPR) repeat protein